VWGADATHIWIVGDDGLLLRYDGTKYRRINLGTSESLLAVSGTARSNVFVTGTNGTIFHFDGASWSPVRSLNAYRQTAIEVLPTAITIVGDLGLGDEILRTCAPTETRCGDAWDDDCDGLMNCADPDCAGNGRCLQGGVCAPAQPLTCGTSVAASTFTGIARIDDIDCMRGPLRGTEATFRFVPAISGSVTVSVGDPSGTLDLALAPALNGGCDITTCMSSTATDTGRTLTADVTAGEPYYVIVDGTVSTGVDFDLALACP
jgi:hypothetical protein